MDPVPGSLVIYKTRCAAVAARTGDKLELRLPGGDSRNVRPKDVIFLHRGPVSSLGVCF